MIPRNFAPDYLLLPLPCGCTADVDDMEIYMVRKQEYARCPWCEASFARCEVIEWLDGDVSDVIVQHAAPPLIRCDDKIFELVGRHSCGSPLVRARNGNVFHLKPCDVEFLRD